MFPKTFKVWTFVQINIILSIALSHASSSDSRHLDHLKLNEVQYIGTHNSYKQQPDSLMYRALVKNSPSIDIDIVEEDLKSYRRLAYGHVTLEAQLDLGIRLFELDLHVATPQNPFNPRGWYEKAFGPDYKVEAPILPKSISDGSVLVYHVGEHDFRSSCVRLSDCLTIMEKWSTSNPNHAPIIIYLEAKSNGFGVLQLSSEEFVKRTNINTFDLKSWKKVEQTVQNIIGDQRLLRPSEIRRDELTLRDSIQQFGWPRIKDLRGKFIFVVSGNDLSKDEYTKISEQRFFIFRPISHPDASFVVEFNPSAKNLEKIISTNLIASTYADYMLLESRTNDTNKRDHLFLEGAQMISTDFPIPDQRFSDYSVRFPDGSYVRARPVIQHPNYELNAFNH